MKQNNAVLTARGLKTQPTFGQCIVQSGCTPVNKFVDISLCHTRFVQGLVLFAHVVILLVRQDKHAISKTCTKYRDLGAGNYMDQIAGDMATLCATSFVTSTYCSNFSCLQVFPGIPSFYQQCRNDFRFFQKCNNEITYHTRDWQCG